MIKRLQERGIHTFLVPVFPDFMVCPEKVSILIYIQDGALSKNRVINVQVIV
jgi:hypothetical protein